MPRRSTGTRETLTYSYVRVYGMLCARVPTSLCTRLESTNRIPASQSAKNGVFYRYCSSSLQ